LDLTELLKGDERNKDVDGDREAYCVGAQTIGDEGLAGTKLTAYGAERPSI
jgi:hypothetical protein